MSSPISDQDDHFAFQTAPKNMSTSSVPLGEKEWKKFQSIKAQGSHARYWISLKSNNTSLRITRGTFLQSLMTLHAGVLEKKLKMFWPIRGQGNHLGFLITSKRIKFTTLLQDLSRKICGKLGDLACSISEEKVYDIQTNGWTDRHQTHFKWKSSTKSLVKVS